MAVEKLLIDNPNLAPGPADPAQYLAAIYRRKWLIILLALTAVATAYLLGIRNPAYQASATVRLSPQALNFLSSPTALNQVLTNDELAKNVIDKGRLNYSRARLTASLKAESVTGSSMAIITATTRNSADAQKIATLAGAEFTSMVKKFVQDVDKERELQTVNRQLDWIDANLGIGDVRGNGGAPEKTIDSKIAALEEELAKAKADGATASNAWMYERLSSLEEQKTNLVTQQIGLITTRQGLMDELNQSGSTGVLMSAQKPTAPVFPSLTRDTALALIAALAAGSGLALAFPAPEHKDI